MFETSPSGDGWVVTDAYTGHPVTGLRSTHQSAAATARILNDAAKAGGRALAKALGCIENGESPYSAVRF